jgi:hypothetical protein
VTSACTGMAGGSTPATSRSRTATRAPRRISSEAVA